MYVLDKEGEVLVAWVYHPWLPGVICYVHRL